MTNIELITEILKIENKEDDIAELKMLYRLSKERLAYIYNAKYMKALRECKIKLTSKEIIKNKISELEDSLNRYSLAEKYKVKQSILKIDIANYEQVLKDLERLENLEKMLDLHDVSNMFKNCSKLEPLPELEELKNDK